MGLSRVAFHGLAWSGERKGVGGLEREGLGVSGGIVSGGTIVEGRVNAGQGVDLISPGFNSSVGILMV